MNNQIRFGNNGEANLSDLTDQNAKVPKHLV